MPLKPNVKTVLDRTNNIELLQSLLVNSSGSKRKREARKGLITEMGYKGLPKGTNLDEFRQLIRERIDNINAFEEIIDDRVKLRIKPKKEFTIQSGTYIISVSDLTVSFKRTDVPDPILTKTFSTLDSVEVVVNIDTVFTTYAESQDALNQYIRGELTKNPDSGNPNPVWERMREKWDTYKHRSFVTLTYGSFTVDEILTTVAVNTIPENVPSFLDLGLMDSTGSVCDWYFLPDRELAQNNSTFIYSLNCVIQALFDHFHDVRGLKKLFKNIDKLCQLLGSRDHQDCLDNGVSLRGLCNFLDSNKLRYRGLDDNYNLIVKGSFEGAAICKMFVFFVSNNHLVHLDQKDKAILEVKNKTPVTFTNENIRQTNFIYSAIERKVQGKNNELEYSFDLDSFDRQSFTVDHFNVLKSRPFTVYYTCKSYHDILKTCADRCIPKPQIKVKKGSIFGLEWKRWSIKLTNVENYVTVKQYCINNDIKFYGQSLGNAIYTKYLKETDMNSALITEPILDIFINWKHNEKYYILDHSRSTSSIDLTRAYQNAMYNNTENYCTFDGINDVVPVTGLDGTGIYYIEFKNKFKEANLFFRCLKGWFYRHTIEYLIQQGFEIDVQYFLKPSRTIANNHFKSIIDEIYTNSNHDEDAKDAVRILSGILRKCTKTCNSKSLIGTKLSCLAYAKESGCDKYLLRVFDNSNDDPDKHIYLISTWSEKIEVINTLPIAHQILENSMVLLHNSFKISGLNVDDICALNCDEIIFDSKCKVLPAPKVSLNKGNEQAMYRFNTQKLLYKSNIPGLKGGRWSENSTIWSKFDERSSYRYESKIVELVEHDQFNYIIENVIKAKRNCIITGLAGTGKSAFIKGVPGLLDPCFGDGYIKLAYTRLAARLIKGETIHHFTKMNLEGEVGKINLTNVKGIIVDEIGLCAGVGYRILKLLQMVKPDLHIVLFGDYNQTEPCKEEGIDYENSRLVKELSGFHRVNLTEAVRQEDKTIVNRYRQILNNEYEPNFSKTKDFCKNITEINICVTNKMRKELNRTLNHWFFRQNAHKGHIEIILPPCACQHCNNPEKPIEIPLTMPILEFTEDFFTQVETFFTEQSRLIAMEKKRVEVIESQLNGGCAHGQRQNMIIFPGCKLIALESLNEIEIGNCDMFTVKKILKDSIEITRDDNPTEIITMTKSQLKNHLTLNYAITVNRCQGMTISEKYSIFQWNHPHNNNKKRYTAYSRCRNENLITIYE